MPVLSIITIVRNDLDGVKRTFASLYKQTHQDVEHLVIDGASTDGTAEWVSKNTVFADTAVVSEPDNGIYDAMNKGLAMAKGEIVCFLNSGDCLATNDVIDYVVRSYRRDQWQWAFGLGQLVDHSFAPVRGRQRAQYRWSHQTFWAYQIHHPAVFMQRRLMSELGGFDCRFRIAADYHLLTKAGRRAHPHVLPRLLAYALDGGVSVTMPEKSHLECHDARVDVLGLRGPLALVDLAWTGVLVMRTRVRRLSRKLVLRLNGR